MAKNIELSGRLIAVKGGGHSNVKKIQTSFMTSTKDDRVRFIDPNPLLQFLMLLADQCWVS